MAIVTITLEPGDIQAGTPLAVDILDFELNVKWRGTAVVGSALTVPFPMERGYYGVQVDMPNGDPATAVLEVGEALEMPVSIALPSGQITAPAEAPPERSRGAAVPRWPAAPCTPVDLAGMWLRLWKQDGNGRWRVGAWPSRLQVQSDGSVISHLPLHAQWRERRRLCCLQIGGKPTHPRLMALPSDDITLVLRPASRIAPDDPAQAVLEVEVRSSAPGADTLLSYLSQGDLGGVRVVGCNTLVDKLVGARSVNPGAAALAAYYLLSVRQLDRLDDLLARDQSDWYSVLPDGAVVDAWRALRQPDPDPSRARRSLVEAARRGVPLYTRGLRLLLDGLRMFEADRTHGDGDVAAAHTRVRRFASAADWRSSFTTYLGLRPDRPFGPKLGFEWLSEMKKASSDRHNVFPWAPGPPADGDPGEEVRRSLRGEMAGAFSLPFLRAFAPPRTTGDVESARKSYEVFRREVPFAFGGQP